MSDAGIGLTSSLGLPPGRYALPDESNPTTLVVMFHGHGNDSCSWRRHLQQAAAHGAIAVAMDYSGQRQTPWENYGWFVKEGAADSITAAKYFKTQYPSINNVIAFGISMGGNTSGLAIAESGDLFNYWVDAEGVNDLIQEYWVARGVAPVNNGGAQAQQEIEEECGGPIESPAATACYASIDNVARAGGMSQLKGAVIINGLDDGLVPTDQSPQMTAALSAVGVKTFPITVAGRGCGETGTTASAIVGDPVFAAAGHQYESPFAGHGWEGSDTQQVIKDAFNELWNIIQGPFPGGGVIGFDPGTGFLSCT